jgi:chromosome segregation ATPase
MPIFSQSEQWIIVMPEDADGHLEDLIKQLDSRVGAIEGEIKSAREEIEQAKRTVDATRDAQQKIEGELSDVRRQIAGTRDDQQALRAELAQRIDPLEKSLSEQTTSLKSRHQQLDALLAARKEEAARQRLEHEKGQFIIRLREMAGQIHDGPVRYVFATMAIEACAARHINSDAFQSLADQKTVVDMLAALDDVKRSVNAADQAQAERFIKIRGLVGEITNKRATYLGQGTDAARTHTALETTRRSHETTIAALSTPEQPRAVMIRRWTQVLSAIIGVVMLALAAVTGSSASDVGIAAAVVLFVGGVVAVVVSWVSSDAGRSWRLKRHQESLQQTIAEIGRLDAAASERERDAQASIASFVRQLAALDIAAPAPGATSSAKALEDLIVAAKAGETSWRSGHSEAQLLFG